MAEETKKGLLERGNIIKIFDMACNKVIQGFSDESTVFKKKTNSIK